jgi:uncharacterized protein YjiS (DUF1127 family)
MTNHHETGLLRLAGETLQSWRDRRRQRRELAALSERELHDFGMSWSEVAYEIEKPFWQA